VPPASQSDGSGGRHDNYGSALAAQPGGSQRRPATNTSSRLIVRIGLPAPSCSRCLCPGWSHHTPRSRRPRPNLGTEIFISVTNFLERLFVEERRRLKIVPNAFGEKAVLKLMYAALIRGAERWRGLHFTEFELRQLDVLRKDLDTEYEVSIKPSGQSAQPRFSSKNQP
jgi:hypothetical protein